MGEARKNVEKGFAFIAPFNAHKKAAAACCYHFDGKVNLGASCV